MPDRERVHEVVERAMTARQIRQELENVEDDARVFFLCEYGDRAGTQQALPATEVMRDEDSRSLRESAYSDSGVAYSEEPQDDPEVIPVAFMV